MVSKHTEAEYLTIVYRIHSQGQRQALLNSAELDLARHGNLAQERDKLQYEVQTTLRVLMQQETKMIWLENQRDKLLDALVACDEAMSYMSEYDIPVTLPQQVKDAIALVMGAA